MVQVGDTAIYCKLFNKTPIGLCIKLTYLNFTCVQQPDTLTVGNWLILFRKRYYLSIKYWYVKNVYFAFRYSFFIILYPLGGTVGLLCDSSNRIPLVFTGHFTFTQLLIKLNLIMKYRTCISLSLMYFCVPRERYIRYTSLYRTYGRPVWWVSPCLTPGTSPSATTTSLS